MATPAPPSGPTPALAPAPRGEDDVARPAAVEATAVSEAALAPAPASGACEERRGRVDGPRRRRTSIQAVFHASERLLLVRLYQLEGGDLRLTALDVHSDRAFSRVFAAADVPAEFAVVSKEAAKHLAAKHLADVGAAPP